MNLEEVYQRNVFDDFYRQSRDIWHYTNVNGLIGILGENPKEDVLHFWFSRSDCLNDTSEGTHIMELFREQIKYLFDKNRINKDYCRLLEQCAPSDLRWFIFRKSKDEAMHICELHCQTYICCFSEKSDSLDMWRGYSPSSSGYSIKINTLAFYHLKDYGAYFTYQLGGMSQLLPLKVIYDKAKKKEILQKVILDYYPYYLEHHLEPNCSNQVTQYINSLLELNQYRFKHDCFASENEYRLLYFYPLDDLNYVENSLPTIHYRTKDGIIIPYLDIEIQNAKTQITEVMLKPGLPNLAQETLKSFLLEHNYSKCEVTKSELPFR